ncbi:MAG TPA: hypothetical protein DDZ51_29300 [Planctomycetaceae bacterium]|nr:hypothetical protein [Planctomycetaceae bacterium]
MAKTFDLRKQLKLHDNALLRRLFAKQDVMAAVSWDELQQRDVEPIATAWEQMGDARQHFQVILQDVNELADQRGQKVLLEEIEWRCPENLSELSKLKSPADKALWAYLEAREAFDQAAIFARAEALRNGQFANRWNSLPKEEITVTDAMIDALQDEVRSYYWQKELRGEVCRVHHYKRMGDADFFFAYLPDWPDKQLIFDADQNLTPREESYAFSNVFVYHPSDGAVELIAKGGKKVQLPLRKAFCRAVLGLEVDDDDPIRAAYQLDHLLDPAFAFTTEPEDRIAMVRLRRLRLVPKIAIPAIEYPELKFKEQASRTEVLQAVDRLLAAFGLNRSQVEVAQASIQLQFMSDGVHKPKTLTFNVSQPNTCDLKSKPDDMRVIGERCLQRWGVLC